jgi:hypothetical protein
MVKSTKKLGEKPPIIRLSPLHPPRSIFLILPLTIYFQIFTYLTPQDLYSLCSVCKKFRKLLWSDKQSIQEIWKKSRMHNLTYPSLSPPPNMVEQQYVWLTLLAKRCQFCKNSYNKFGYSVWVKREVLCSKCFSERTLLVRCESKYFLTCVKINDFFLIFLLYLGTRRFQNIYHKDYLIVYHIRNS